MRVTLQHYESSITVKTARDDLDICEVRDELIRPLLLAAGFAPESVEDAFGECKCTRKSKELEKLDESDPGIQS